MAEHKYKAKYCLRMTFCDCLPFIVLLMLALGWVICLSLLLLYMDQTELPKTAINKKHKLITQTADLNEEQDNVWDTD